jgi:hypothetical protein
MFMNPASSGTNTGAPAAAPSYYGSQPVQQQQQPAASHDDWYSETTTTPAASVSAPNTSSMYRQQSQQQPQYQQQQTQQQQPQYQQPQAMNPYATPSSSSLEGAMDSGSGHHQQSRGQFSQHAQQPAQDVYGGSIMSGTPMTNDYNSGDMNTHSNYGNDEIDFENELPLLEELGINLQHIVLKTKAVVIPSQRLNKSALMDPAMIVEDADLAGPLAFALLLGGELLLTGKIHFGYIYGFGLFGCLAMTVILNLMSPQGAVSVWTVTSILGYCLLPVNILALVKILLVNIANLSTLGRFCGVLTVVWSTTASTRLLEVGCGMRDQRYLIAYPIALLYSAFVLITIF